MHNLARAPSMISAGWDAAGYGAWVGVRSMQGEQEEDGGGKR